MKKAHVIFILKVLISALFLLSAVAKSFPIWAFEKQLVDLGIVDWCLAPYLCRAIIAMETAIAIAILQKHFLKTFVIPLTMILLVIFCVHLGIQIYQSGAMNGNCGCFGQLIPMTPLEALLKNIATIAILWYLYKNVSDLEKGANRFIYLLFIYTLSALIMFAMFPFAPCKDEDDNAKLNLPVIITDTVSPVADSTGNAVDTSASVAAVTVDTAGKTKPSADTAVRAVPAPARMKSPFSEFTEFSGKSVNLDEGKKLVCLFVPGCDHCRHAAKDIVALSKKVKMPPVYIIFMNEELFKLPEFFEETKAKYPYYVLDNIPKFFKLLGNGSTPGVFYMWNGNIIRAWEGINDHEFKIDGLKQVIQSEQNAPDPAGWWLK